MENKNLRFKLNSPLNKLDTEKQTYGCRHTNPDICNNCMLPDICAFTSKDCICKKPSASWKKYYKKLKEDKNENRDI